MLTSQSHQKSYANKGRHLVNFEVGNQVFLKVSPMKGVMHFDKKGKLSPRYVGPFIIIEIVGPVAYRVELPPKLAEDTRCISCINIKKICTWSPAHC
jgi:hypothetical protein